MGLEGFKVLDKVTGEVHTEKYWKKTGESKEAGHASHYGRSLRGRGNSTCKSLEEERSLSDVFKGQQKAQCSWSAVNCRKLCVCVCTRVGVSGRALCTTMGTSAWLLLREKSPWRGLCAQERHNEIQVLTAFLQVPYWSWLVEGRWGKARAEAGRPTAIMQLKDDGVWT